MGSAYRSGGTLDAATAADASATDAAADGTATSGPGDGDQDGGKHGGGCTAGTTVTGAFDPFNAVADVARAHGLWMHVDASWGGSLLLSDKHRGALAGAERADSVTWNAHKMMGTPLQCSAFLTRHKGAFFSFFALCVGVAGRVRSSSSSSSRAD